MFAQRASAVPGGVLLPFHLDISSGQASCTHDLTHSWAPQHLCWDHGTMADFVKVHTMDEYEGPGYGPLTMGYYRRNDVPYHYALADAFTLCDNYHCSVMGPTHPNRLMAVSGTLDPAGLHGGPVLITNPSPSAKFSVDWPTMPEVLEDAGVSWKVYNPPGPLYDVSMPGALAVTDSVMAYFKQFSNPGSTLYDKAFNYTFPDDFTADIRNGTLPKVSWLIPMVGHDEHPRPRPASGPPPSTRCSGRCSITPRSGRRPSCSSCTTRTTASSTTLRPRWRPRAPPASTSRSDPSPRPPGGSPGPSASASGCPCSWSPPSAGADGSSPRSPTTPRSYASWRSGSGCAPPTSRTGAARRSRT